MKKAKIGLAVVVLVINYLSLWRKAVEWARKVREEAGGDLPFEIPSGIGEPRGQ